MIYDNKFRRQLKEQNIDITKCKKISFLKDKNLDHPIINYNPDTKSLKIIDSKPIFFTDETKFKDFEDLEELILYNINTNNITTMN